MKIKSALEITKLSPVELKELREGLQKWGREILEEYSVLHRERNALVEGMLNSDGTFKDKAIESEAHVKAWELNKKETLLDEEDNYIDRQWSELIKAVDIWKDRWEAPNTLNELLEESNV